MLAVGIVVLFLGVFIVTRPLTSLWLLAVLVGVSAIVAGVIDLADSSGRRSCGAGSSPWCGSSAASPCWSGSVAASSCSRPSSGILLIVGGVWVRLAGVGRGRVSERVLAVASGLGQIVFGGLALLWPDLTLLIAAVLFGIRTVIYGVALIWRAGRRLAGKPARLGGGAQTRRGLLLADAARYALSVVFVVLAGSAWWVNGWLAEGSPVVDSFYDAPSRRRPTKPECSSARMRMPAPTRPAARCGASCTARPTRCGVRAVASALVIAPIDPPSGPAPGDLLELGHDRAWPAAARRA